jgi:putative heme-binding domain-containing protein
MNFPKLLALVKRVLSLRGVVCALALYLGCCEASLAQSASAARVPWMVSKVKGHPGRPAAFDLQRMLPDISFDNPVELVAMPGTRWMWMMELRGGIYAFDPASDSPEKHLVIHLKTHQERMADAYGMAFHPDFKTNRQVYLCYVLGGGGPDDTRVSKFIVSDTQPPVILPESEQVLLTWKGGGHNGGCLRFGPDGYLYITTGDGTGPNPPDILKTGQDISDLLASVLRIDVDHQDPGLSYAIPADNPFVRHPDARPEVWAFGFRNPFKMNFDQENGDLWVGDVGWELWELIHRVEKGGNYGWSIMEGNHLVQEGLPQGPGMFRAPIVEHPHSEAASITGGYVYRGRDLSDLRGAYIYSDYETGKIWGLRVQGDQVVWHEELTDAPFRVITFGEDHQGELWVVDYAGGLYQLRPHTGEEQGSDFPEWLSQTGLFEDVGGHIPSPGVYPYEVEMPHWENGAMARRWVGLPGTARVKVADRAATFPADAVLVKTLFWPNPESIPGSEQGKPIETQLMHYDGQHWNAYVYAWDARGKDARLVKAEGQTLLADDSNSALSGLNGEYAPSAWHYEARTNCLRCHNSWSGYALGWNKLQLRGTMRADDGVQASWDRLNQLKLTNREQSRNTGRGEKMNDLEYRARAYLHANCGHCHRENAGAMVQSLMYFEKPLAQASLVNQATLRGDFGLTDASVIEPGDPFRSVLYVRMAKTGAGQMPHLGMQGGLDVEGLKLVFDWIRSLGKVDSGVADRTTEVLNEIERIRNQTHAGDMQAAIHSLGQHLTGVLGLAHAMDRGWLDERQKEMVGKLYRELNDPVRRDVLRRFFESSSNRMDALDVTLLDTLKPDIENGRRMFFEDASLQCGTCHKVNGKGGDLGPDLGRVAEKYTQSEALKHILQPSLVVEPEFGVISIETQNGLLLTGVLQQENEQGLVLMDVLGQKHQIDPATIIDRQRSSLSAMPEGLLTGRKPQEVVDLLGFLGYDRKN